MFKSGKFMTGLLIVLLAAAGANAAPIEPGAPDYAWAFDDGAGATTASASFGSVNGQISGASDSATTHFSYSGNRSLEFDGTNDLVSLTGINLSSGNNTITVSAWVYSQGSSANEGVIFGNWFQGDDHQSVLLQELDSDRTRLLVRQANDNANNTGTSTFSKNTWVHIVGVWSGTSAYDGTGSLYINGSLVSSTTTAGVLGDLADEGTYGIAGDTGTTDTKRYFDGYMDEVAVWKSALSADEVSWLYNNSMTTIPEPSCLVVLGAGMVVAVLRRRSRLG